MAIHNVVHLHQGQSRNTERVSQALLGASLAVVDEGEDWLYVQGDDTYRGWAERRFLATKAEPSGDTAMISQPFAELRRGPERESPLVLRLSIGARVFLQNVVGERASVSLPGGESGWLDASAIAPLPVVAPAEIPGAALGWAERFLGTPYLWGGSSAYGLDCSGLAQLCYRLAGIVLRRDADIQRSDSRFDAVAFDDMAPGDLVFFGKPDNVTHVGLHAGDGKFLHAAGGAGTIVTAWGDDRYSPGFLDARRLVFARAGEPPTRFEAQDR